MTAPQTVADAQHTPGPWAASRQKARRVTANGVVICNAVLRNTGSAKNGRKHGQKAEAEAEAHARLIAAAPTLFDAAVDACLSIRCAAGVDEGAGEDDAYTEILKFGGSSLASAYLALRAAATSARQGETK